LVEIVLALKRSRLNPTELPNKDFFIGRNPVETAGSRLKHRKAAE
jgi:hypothetical protein